MRSFKGGRLGLTVLSDWDKGGEVKRERSLGVEIQKIIYKVLWDMVEDGRISKVGDF